MSPIRSALALLFLAASVSAAAQSPRDSILVSPQWLSQHMNDPNMVILHTGQRANYDSAHAPGARFVALDDISVSDHESPTGIMLQMPPADSLRATLQRLGISDSSRIAVLFGGEFITSATRVIFTLHHAGFGNRVVLVDGGINAWKRAGLPVTTEAPTVQPSRLSPLKLQPTIVSAEFVRDSTAKPGIVLVDARAQGFYDGVQEGGSMTIRKRGHIPNAKSVPFNTLADDNIVLLPVGELMERFAGAGVKPGDRVVAYCHIGQQATLVVFAARTLGLDVKLFDGSYEDWVNRGWPVEVPPPFQN